MKIAKMKIKYWSVVPARYIRAHEVREIVDYRAIKGQRDAAFSSAVAASASWLDGVQ